MTDRLKIAQVGSPVLRERAEIVENSRTDEIKNLVNDLLTIIKEKKVIGVSAPQIYKSKRIFVLSSRPTKNYPDESVIQPTVIINPEIITYDKKKEIGWEGCLSIPDIRGKVSRYKSIQVSYTDISGKIVETKLTGLASRVFQHEYDHLEGILFIDRIKSPKDIITEKEFKDLKSRYNNGN